MQAGSFVQDAKVLLCASLHTQRMEGQLRKQVKRASFVEFLISHRAGCDAGGKSLVSVEYFLHSKSG